ncbi:MAG: tetratricopeptide repeat protein [Saprospiraceae bacterium]
MDHQEFNAEQVFNQAMAAHQSGQIDKAIEHLQNILQHMPEQDGIMSTLGGVYLSSGKIQDGINLLEKAIQINPKNIEAQLNLGIAYQSIGNAEESFQLMSNAAKLAPERADVQFNFSNSLLQRQQYEEAIIVLNQLIKLHPSFIQGYHNLGSVYSFLGKTAEAQKVYEQALESVPNDLQSMLALGNLLATIDTEKAHAIYLEAIKIHPNNFLPYAVIGKFYLEIGKEKEGQEALERALALNPNDLETNILLGNVCKNLGNMEGAEKLYRQALLISPDNKRAQQNLRRILAVKIPYWHFEMLADTDRNDAYQKAIEKIIDKDSIVLDIGTGSGLLSMMAARAGAKQITACEMHQRLASTAKQITKRNGFEDIITVFAKKSNDLKVGEEMPAKANIIISEILDCGALGEAVLPSIRHAVQNLATPDVKLIPARVNLFGQLIEIPSRSLVAPIREISGFDLSLFEEYRIPGEYLKINLKGEKYKILSPVIPLMDVDFYNLPTAYPEDQPKKIPLQINIDEGGMAQAMVFWFDLYLDEEIKVSSKMDGELEHWGQALFCFPNPKKVEKGEVFSVTMLQSDQMIKFEM